MIVQYIPSSSALANIVDLQTSRSLTTGEVSEFKTGLNVTTGILRPNKI
jgi:hypothetical protein